MRTDDQYFQPGDKVMRVRYGQTPDGFARTGNPQGPVFGKVYYVQAVLRAVCGWNAMTLVGVPTSPGKIGYLCYNFRRVEEIQLCVRAAERAKKPEEQTV